MEVFGSLRRACCEAPFVRDYPRALTRVTGAMKNYEVNAKVPAAGGTRKSATRRAAGHPRATPATSDSTPSARSTTACGSDTRSNPASTALVPVPAYPRANATGADPALAAILDPHSPSWLPRPPRVPAGLLRQVHCLVESDGRYRAALRMRMAILRESLGLQPGRYLPGGRRDTPLVPLGSMLRPTDAAAGLNFFDARVYAFVKRTLALAEEGANLHPDRIYRNMLSSEPLCFNLLAPLALDLDLATAVFRQLLPDFVRRVVTFRFETASSRFDPAWLGDGSAHDAAVEVVTVERDLATVFIELKLSEDLSGPPATPRPRYDSVAQELGLYGEPDAPILRSVALEQFRRLHLLAGLAIRHKLTTRAHLLVVAPRLNRQVERATRLYADELIDPTGASPATVGFTALTLETFVAALAAAGATHQASYLAHRYLDLSSVLERVLQYEPVAGGGTQAQPNPSPDAAADTSQTASSVPGTALPPDARTARKMAA